MFDIKDRVHTIYNDEIHPGIIKAKDFIHSGDNGWYEYLVSEDSGRMYWCCDYELFSYYPEIIN